MVLILCMHIMDAGEVNKLCRSTRRRYLESAERAYFGINFAFTQQSSLRREWNVF